MSKATFIIRGTELGDGSLSDLFPTISLMAGDFAGTSNGAQVVLALESR